MLRGIITRRRIPIINHINLLRFYYSKKSSTIKPFSTDNFPTKMGAICSSKKQADYLVDETNHGSGWGVPPVKKKLEEPVETPKKEATTESAKKEIPAAAETPKEEPTKPAEQQQQEPQRRKSSAAPRPKSTSKANDIEAVKAAIVQVMKRPGHDDGSMGPVFIRLAWHSCGTYDKEKKTGGSSTGATMRFPPERDDPENNGLDIARDALEPIQKQFPWISLADLWILAGTVAIKEMGGPEVEVRLGRKDHPGPTSPIQNGNLPNPERGVQEGKVVEGTNRLQGWDKLVQHIRDTFYRMGFDDQEIAALICGGHAFGRVHRQHSGYNGAWVETPTEFTNEFAADLIGDEWRLVDGSNAQHRAEVPDEVCPAPGKRQYVTKIESEHPQMMLPADMVFLWDEKFKGYVSKYAEDADLLKKEFGVAWKKLIELGCEDVLQ